MLSLLNFESTGDPARGLDIGPEDWLLLLELDLWIFGSECEGKRGGGVGILELASMDDRRIQTITRKLLFRDAKSKTDANSALLVQRVERQNKHFS